MRGGTRRSLLRWFVAVGGGVWLACVALTLAAGLGGVLFQNVLALLADSFAVAVVAVRAFRPGDDQAGWRALAVAMGMWTTGELIRVVLYLDGARPSPSLPDLFYLAFYPGAYVGLIRMVRAR